MILKMAFRNLRRYRAKTFLTVAAIGLGTGLALFSIGLGDGGHFQMIENGVRVGQGHLTVQREGFLEAPSTSLYISEPAAWTRMIAGSDYVMKVYPRIRGEGILATAAGAEGAPRDPDPLRRRSPGAALLLRRERGISYDRDALLCREGRAVARKGLRRRATPRAWSRGASS